MATAPPQAGRKATYADVLAAPPDRIAEVLGGELVVSPRPAVPHALVSSVLGSEILGRFHRKPGGGDAPGGWWILDEPELHLAEDILVPDLAGWRRERLPRVPADPFLTVCPDWVCEVLSPGTQGTDRVRKMAIYAREQVGHVWLVDPAARILEVYQLSAAGGWTRLSIFEGNTTIRAEPFDVEFDMSRWWIEED